jgi:hypothetical protein
MYMPVQCKWKYNAQAKCAVKVTLLMQKKSNTLQKKAKKLWAAMPLVVLGRSDALTDRPS